jgi:methylthioribulose-1-phosphate dehydratase
MAHTFDQLETRQALAEMARDFHRRGWMAGTAGNLSVRDRASPAGFWITASGLPKGRLDEQDFLLMDLETERVLERLSPAAQPSAETAIHRVIYQLFPEAGACLHVHSVAASLAVAGLAPDAEELPLPPLEMVKGLGLWEERPVVSLPLFPNWRDVSLIAGAIRRRFSATPPRLPALMVHSHGATVWGGSLQEAYNRVEVVEFLMSYLAGR